MHNLMNMKMTRQEFLQFVGVSLVSVIGLSHVITLLSQLNQNKQLTYTPTKKAEIGFGTRKFGE
jgi:hypothetical protein